MTGGVVEKVCADNNRYYLQNGNRAVCRCVHLSVNMLKLDLELSKGISSAYCDKGILKKLCCIVFVVYRFFFTLTIHRNITTKTNEIDRKILISRLLGLRFEIFEWGAESKKLITST